MSNWQLADPYFLLLVLLAPVVYCIAARTASMLGYSSLETVDRAPRSWRARLIRLPAVLLALAVVLLAVALARPRTPDAQTKVFREGISIMAVIDRSGSMEARDMVPTDRKINRLDVVKEVFGKFILGEKEREDDGRPDDLVGLISFAGYADSLCPLTLDHGNLMTIVDDMTIETNREEGGTAIGEGLALAVERLRQSKAKSKVVILLTDGANNRGNITPDQAARLAAEHDIKVYCIGVGREGVVPMPMLDPFTGREVLAPAQSEFDEKALKEIAAKTGGHYFKADDKKGLEEIYKEIDRLERTKITETRYLQYTEYFQPFVWLSLCTIGLACVLSGTVLRRLP